jgi:hypothetical protein
MKIKNLILSILIIFCFTVTINVEGSENSLFLSKINAFRNYKDINNLSIKIPTVVEIPLMNDYLERFDFSVYNKTTNSFEPYFFKQETLINQIPVSIYVAEMVNDIDKMIDGDNKTHVDFLLPESKQGQVLISLNSQELITSSTLTVLLDDNVALPNSIEIRANVDGKDKIVIANKKMDKTTISFPETTSKQWSISFFYTQPLRISELILKQNNALRQNTQTIRFLAQPENDYRIYLNSDRSINIKTTESGNLMSAKDVFEIPPIVSKVNPDYKMADIDGDGVPDIYDNCISIFNPDQKDINDNKIGDACEDWDYDGILNIYDNCPNNPNQDQTDTDNDGIGDACDSEESRITERYPWIPWAGIGFAVIVLVILIILTNKTEDKIKIKEGENN